VVAQIGPIDILVNNAGIQRRGPLEDFAEETWREVLSTNLDSIFYVSKAVVQHMIPRKSGAIINICSVMSEVSRPTIGNYAAAKGGLKMLTRAMAVEWAKHGIQANAIAPGYMLTDMNTALVEDKAFNDWVVARTPARRWGKPASWSAPPCSSRPPRPTT
ncbi:MAG TPA: SDR family NAD(P)-dependent oxidoreductase, partial [Acetobacteraceae bacterium]|nr:SDR family NAD(P)-dependent oxidoreductase [Acetobacteraceae bacterium]